MITDTELVIILIAMAFSISALGFVVVFLLRRTYRLLELINSLIIVIERMQRYGRTTSLAVAESEFLRRFRASNGAGQPPLPEHTPEVRGTQKGVGMDGGDRQVG